MAKLIDLDLQKQAACRGQTEVFYADSGPVSNKIVRNLISKARALCNTCPIQVECLMTAVNNQEEHGIWGGLTSKERRYHFGWEKKVTVERVEGVVRWARRIG